jgi:NAD(P)-dependent dehydrogenase (short-subunit alcohol dehydrogenase family)
VLGSTSAFLPQAAYASSKAAIIGLTRDLAQQWTGRKKLRVNALAPGFFVARVRAILDRLARDLECAHDLARLRGDQDGDVAGVHERRDPLDHHAALRHTQRRQENPFVQQPRR